MLDDSVELESEEELEIVGEGSLKECIKREFLGLTPKCKHARDATSTIGNKKDWATDISRKRLLMSGSGSFSKIN